MEKITDLTEQELLNVLKDPYMLAKVIYSLGSLRDLEAIVEEHGYEKIVSLAIDVAVKSERGGLND